MLLWLLTKIERKPLGMAQRPPKFICWSCRPKATAFGYQGFRSELWLSEVLRMDPCSKRNSVGDLQKVTLYNVRPSTKTPLQAMRGALTRKPSHRSVRKDILIFHYITQTAILIWKLVLYLKPSYKTSVT